MATKKEETLLNAWLNEPRTGTDSPLYKARCAATQRNSRQRARRASPEAKAKEALASRKSYWRAKARNGFGGDLRKGCCCCICAGAERAGVL